MADRLCAIIQVNLQEVEMAKKYRQDKSKTKGIITAAASAGAVAVIYSSIFSVGSFLSFIVMAALAALGGFLGYTVGSGLDTTQESPKSRAAVKKTGSPQVDMIIEKGSGLLLEIRRENERIPDPVITKQLDELESVAGKIFRAVEEQPEKAPQIRRFLEYYLPTTLSMLKNYRRIEEQKLSSEKAEQTLKSIENAMGVVLGAFKKQLDMLYRDDFLDLSADMQVMETILKQDNLIDEGVSFGAENAFSSAAQEYMREEAYARPYTSGEKKQAGAAWQNGFAGAQAQQKKED